MGTDDRQQANNNNNNNRRREDKSSRRAGSRKHISSTTSLGKRRRMDKKGGSGTRRASPGQSDQDFNNNQQTTNTNQPSHHKQAAGSPATATPTNNAANNNSSSTMSEPRQSEYGSQATLLRNPLHRSDEKPTKVTVLGAAGGIGQPLSLLLMLHSEYIQHLALYDLAHVRGVGADLGHVDRQCRLTTHLGPEELVDAVRDANVIIILAGIAQKPGMSRDDLFGTNAKIIYDLAKVCAQNAPDAHLAVVSNPVNSLVPIVDQVYARFSPKNNTSHHQSPGPAAAVAPPASNISTTNNASSDQAASSTSPQRPASSQSPAGPGHADGELPAWRRRIFGVTTLDVVRASTLVAKSPFFSSAQPTSKLFNDPSKVTVPVVGGHAGKTILPLLSRASPSIERSKLERDMRLTCKVIESIQEAGIDVLNAKRGAGSATLAMAYSACRFTISLLRAQLGETSIVECAYVRHPRPIFDQLEYFALPLVLGKHGWTKALNPLHKLLPFEREMAEEAARLLRMSVARGEDFAKEHLSIEKN